MDLILAVGVRDLPEVNDMSSEVVAYQVEQIGIQNLQILDFG